MISETPNQTQSFLGPESTWPAAQIHLRDVQGLWGGRNIFLDGAGRAVVQIVSEGLWEERYEFQLGLAEVAGLLQQFIANAFVTIRVPDRPGIPDEAWPEIVLVNAAGERHAAAKWAGQQHEQFDNLYRLLLALGDRTQGLAPVHSGPFDWDFVPEGFWRK